MVVARGVRAEEVEPYTDDIELYPVEIELIEDESQPPDTDDEDKIREYWDTHAVTDFNSEPVPREEWPVGGGGGGILHPPHRARGRVQARGLGGSRGRPSLPHGGKYA